MATLLRFPAPVPTAGRATTTAAGPAEIIILPCIRRERMGEVPVYSGLADARCTQRQA
ncbi:hypothetical protein [Aureimonas sp. Leaf454]|uniref:hypothetical protein n=1 Tax=Aureimonas sp. Leaf454 TaxID=1736381 RepID=UPI000B2192B5|nr:hypothetical protein [Aureimonas sp. Leaf454]